MAALSAPQMSALNLDLQFGNTDQATAAAEALAAAAEAVDPEFVITIYDPYWVSLGEITGDVISHSGRDPRNDLPAATLQLKGNSVFIANMMNCRNTMVGITIETEAQRWAFYVDTHEYEITEKGVPTGTANLLGIWDILNFYQVWPDNLLPVAAQPISYAIFIGSLVTVIESMVALVALRLQSGIWDFVNNVTGLSPSFQSWFAALILNNPNVAVALQTPVYVIRTNPNDDTSEIVARTVRMESCGTVIKDITRAYGVDVDMALWLPGDDQPDQYANLVQPTYVLKVVDRESLTAPASGLVGSVIKTSVELLGALGENTAAQDAVGAVLDPGNTLQNATASAGSLADLGIFTMPSIGVDWVPPYVLFVAPDPGAKGSVYSCKIVDHTPKGWQHIIGGRSPQWAGAPQG